MKCVSICVKIHLDALLSARLKCPANDLCQTRVTPLCLSTVVLHSQAPFCCKRAVTCAFVCFAQQTVIRLFDGYLCWLSEHSFRMACTSTNFNMHDKPVHQGTIINFKPSMSKTCRMIHNKPVTYAVLAVHTKCALGLQNKQCLAFATVSSGQ